MKKMFLEISQNSQENTCARASFFNKVAVEHLWWLLLNVAILLNQMQPKIKKSFFNISIRLIVIDEIRQISRKKLDFAKLTEARPEIS